MARHIVLFNGVDASGDSVGGEGFTNFGDVQFVQDASLERYLESAKAVADHAVVGAGPLRFSPDIGRSGTLTKFPTPVSLAAPVPG